MAPRKPKDDSGHLFWLMVSNLATDATSDILPFICVECAEDRSDATEVTASDGSAAYRLRFEQDRWWLGFTLADENQIADERPVLLRAEDIATPDVRRAIESSDFSATAQRPLIEGTWDEDYSTEQQIVLSGGGKTTWLDIDIGGDGGVDVGGFISSAAQQHTLLGSFDAMEAWGEALSFRGDTLALFALSGKLWLGEMGEGGEAVRVVPIGGADRNAGKAWRGVTLSPPMLVKLLRLFSPSSACVGVYEQSAGRFVAYFHGETRGVKCEATVAQMLQPNSTHEQAQTKLGSAFSELVAK